LAALDPVEFRALFEAHSARLQRFLCHLTGNASDAEDLLQETFLSVWKKRDQYEGRGSAEGYLRRTAFHLFLNQREKRLRRDALAPPAVETYAAPADDALLANDALGYLILRVREAVHALPQGPREAFILFRFEGLSCAEIADATGAPLKTVEGRLARATRLLAERLERHRHLLPTS
jgi:RNA polymerase sigma-70 factor (ECF subfamily)